MRRLVYTQQAQADLNSIALYIIRESGFRKTALNYTAGLRHKCQKLAELPGTLGRARPELNTKPGPDLRTLAHDNYVIFFRYSDDAVEIVTILHASRDIDSPVDAD